GYGASTTVTDENGHTRTYTYSGAGNLASATTPLGRTTSYTYDTDRNNVSATNREPPTRLPAAPVWNGQKGNASGGSATWHVLDG
ncbi:MAG: hypothetical protein COZ06_34105, partial [Armatimonadetes bacterium CG_4_10_14_3_um_filter_66_18]